MKRAAILAIAALVAAGASAGGKDAERQAATRPAQKTPATRPKAGQDKAPEPAGNLDYWLNRARTAETTPPEPLKAGTNPFGSAGPRGREDALPGVVELSDGAIVPGWVYTTRAKPWEVYLAAEKRWRRIPFLTVLSIRAVLKQERMELAWRWKAMGEPEKVYTGAKYPFRRFEWKLHLIDGSYVTGVIKGQPLYIEPVAGGPRRIFVLRERDKGKPGQSLKDLVYAKRVIVSRRLMDAVAAEKLPPPKAPAEQNRRRNRG